MHVTTTDMSLDLLLGPQLQAFRDAGWRVSAASAAGQHVDRIRSWGIDHFELQYATREFALRRDLLALRELVLLFRRVRPDIVHTHNPKPGVIGRLAARLARVPAVVNTQHGLYAQPGDPASRRLPVYTLERLAATFSDVELIQNEEDLATLRALGVPMKRLSLLGNGIDLDCFRPRGHDVRDRVRHELGAAANRLVVGSVGRLVREKGMGEYLAAAQSIARSAAEPPVFVVVGPSDNGKADALQRREVREAELAGVKFLGMREDMPDLYAAMDIFVLATYREGFPRSVMEAAAMGVPTVATDVRGCRQAVRHGETGLLVTPRDPASLETAIRLLLCDSDLRTRMSTAATQLAREEFDQQRVIERTLSIYRELI